MTKSKTVLQDLSNHALTNRILAANRRLYALQAERARREKIGVYGTDNPELSNFNVEVEATFSLTVRAVDRDDARRVVDEEGWLEWYGTTPGDAVSVDDWGVEPGEPELVEEPNTAEDLGPPVVQPRTTSGETIH